MAAETTGGTMDTFGGLGALITYGLPRACSKRELHAGRAAAYVHSAGIVGVHAGLAGALCDAARDIGTFCLCAATGAAGCWERQPLMNAARPIDVWDVGGGDVT
eukprot:gene18673-55420_t